MDLKISAAIANQPRSEPSSSMSGTKLSVDAGNSMRTATATRCERSGSTSSSGKKLPPSPLVTPPMGSNPSQAAQEAVSPRNLLSHSSPESQPSTAPPDDLAPSSSSGQQSPASASRKNKHDQKGIPHVYHDYSKLSGPGPAYIRKKTGGVTQRE